ncbi:MAG: DeoR family transcriptional regulator [Candidatus Kaiserbacteria bacterium]|nr:DeoR family transcriptional regulator [Candidatus Kaiserbacteria bacterium]
MGHELSYIGHKTENRQAQIKIKDVCSDDFVLEKSIFNNIFEKDIRRVFIYKKTERLAKAIHLITPAFSESASLKSRIDSIAMNLIDAAMLQPGTGSIVLSRELLALSSILSLAKTSGLLSHMNAEIIARETRILLEEVADYEEPRLLLEETPTLSHIAKNVLSRNDNNNKHISPTKHVTHNDYIKGRSVSGGERHIKDTEKIKDRRETILSVIKNKQKANIKDISTLIRGVSEKTIQRELSALVDQGVVLKQGERRWSTYSLV